MPSSEVEIVNSALVKIGEETVASLNQATRQARVAAQQLPLKRDYLLRRYRWNFCVTRAELAPSASEPAFGFDEKFLLPSDCLQVIGLYDDNEPLRNYTSSKHPWKVEGRYIHANLNPLKIIYKKRVEDVAQFDVMFSEALAWLMAWELSYFLSTGPDLTRQAREGFYATIREAKLADAVEGSPEVISQSEWLDARWDAYGTHGGPYRAGPIY